MSPAPKITLQSPAHQSPFLWVCPPLCLQPPITPFRVLLAPRVPMSVSRGPTSLGVSVAWVGLSEVAAPRSPSCCPRPAHSVIYAPPARDSHRHAPHSVPREEEQPCQEPSAHLPPCLASTHPPPSRGSHSTAGSFAVNKRFEDQKKKKKKVRVPHYLSVIEIISVKQFHKLDPGHSLEMPFQ